MWIGAGLLWSASAAETGCEPLDVAGFRALAAEARARIAEDDPAGHAEISERLTARIPCLSEVIPPGDWAEYLVGLAAVRYRRGEDWQAPLASALRIAPEVDRLVRPGSEIALWSPPPAAPGAGPVPEGIALFVDGLGSSELPAPPGLHLVQARTADGLRSALLSDQPFPEGWLLAPPPEGGSGSAWQILTVGLSGGAIRRSQSVDPAGDFATDQQSLGPELGGAARAALGAGPAGLAVELLVGSSPRVDGAALGFLGGPRASVGLGVSASTVDRLEGGEVRRSVLAVPALSASGRLGTGGGAVADIGLLLGWSPALGRGVLRAGLAPGDRPLRLRYGVEARARRAWFVQPDTGRTLDADQLSLVAELGLAWIGETEGR